MNKLISFILGALLGSGICFGFLSKSNKIDNTYFVLMEDYCIENVGSLKKGTKIKYDQGFSEGFTRYVLYLNLPGSEVTNQYSEDKDKENLVIPYWLTQKDSTGCQ